MDKASFKNKAKKDIRLIIKDGLIKKFNEVSEQIKSEIMREYDSELVDVVTDRNSRTNPKFYREDFFNRLSSFDYIDDSEYTVTLNVPDMENFDFSGRLKVLETIMEGVIGTYVELDEDQYVSIFNKKPLREESFDEYVSPKERIYIVKYTGKIRLFEKEMNVRFVEYPFSNTPPINILEAGERLVNGNIDRWIDDVIKESNKRFSNSFKGVK